MKLNAPELNAADSLIDYLCERIDDYTTKGDPLRDRYVGFCAVAAAAHIETLVKGSVLDFCKEQNKYLYAVFDQEFQRFNGRIAYKELRTLLGRFDVDAEKRLVALVGRLKRYLARAAVSPSDVISAYESLLVIRHSFSHNINATFPHITSTDIRGYIRASKHIASAFLRCLPK